MWVAPGVGADSRANELCREEGAQARIMWFDAEANLWQLSTREGVADTVRRCKDAGINTIIVDVKPLSGLVLYQSKIAPRLTESGGKPYPPDYDLLATVIDDGHKAGIPVHAAINVFSEGSQKVGRGVAFTHQDWQCVEYGMERTICASDGTSRRLVGGSAPWPVFRDLSGAEIPKHRGPRTTSPASSRACAPFRSHGQTRIDTDGLFWSAA